MNKVANMNGAKLFACAVALASLAACGGGGSGGGFPSFGGGNVAAADVAVSGVVAKGAMLVGATVGMTCANGTKLAGTTNGNGSYVTNQAALTYPCIGTAKSGAISYRSVLFSGTVVNFTPLTDILVEVMLAASMSGSGSMTMDQFISKIGSDAAFANNVSSTSTAGDYRTAALDVVKAQLIAAGRSDADATAILSAARSQKFDASVFAVGSELDKVLDNIASVVQDSEGSVNASVLVAAKTKGDLLPVPASGATGATGATGG